MRKKKWKRLLACALSVVVYTGVVVWPLKVQAQGNTEEPEAVAISEQIAAPDPDIWLAETMISGYNNAGNGLYPMFRNYQEPVYKQLGGYLLEDVPLVSMSTAWSIFFNSEYRNQFANEQKYIYEVILMDYLKYNADGDNISSELKSAEFDFSIKLYDELSEYLSLNRLDYVTDMTVEETIAFCEEIDTIENLNTAISKVKKFTDTTKELLDAVSGYLALQKAKDTRVELFRSARDACQASDSPNQDFIAAADELISILDGTVIEYAVGETVDFAWGKACDFAWDKLCDANPVLKAIEFGVAGLDGCFDTSNRASNDLKLALLYTTDCYLNQGMMRATDRFLSDKTSGKAMDFNVCFSAYVEFQMFGNDYSDQWLEEYLNSGAYSRVINAIFYSDNIRTAKELAVLADSQVSTRKSLQKVIDKYADIYVNTYGSSKWKEEMLDNKMPVNGISFKQQEVWLNHADDIFVAYADVSPSDAANKNVTYQCSDSSILEIPKDGGFGTVRGSGTVTITATTEDGGYTATQTVHVNAQERSTVADSGMCGDNVKWMLYSDGTLYIYGDGEMDSYTYIYNGNTDTYSYLTPWWNERNSISKVVLGDGIKSIGKCAFIGCSNLTKITFGEEFQTISEGETFKGCTSFVEFDGEGKYLKSNQGILYSKDMSTLVAVPTGREGDFSVEDGTEVISKGAFWWCSKLTSVRIPESVLDMYGYRYYEFMGCDNLQTIDVSDSNVNYYSIDGVLFGTGKGAVGKYYPWVLGSYGIYKPYLIAYPSAKDNAVYSIPQGVKAIEPGAFDGADNLEKVIFPDSIECIYEYSFDDCKNINNITFLGDIPNINLHASNPTDSFLKIFRGLKNDLKIHVTEDAVFKDPSNVWIDEQIIFRDVIQYTITAAASEGGEISPAGRTAVLKGENLTYIITPFAGYILSDVKIDDVSVGIKYSYTFNNVTENHTIKAIFTQKHGGNESGQNQAGNVFADVKSGEWYYDSVRYVNSNGLMTGLNATTFGPTQSLARAQFAVILHRMNNMPEVTYTAKFPDVPDGVWYTDAILWASSTGVVTGYSDTGRFGPSDNINREQMAVMMYRYAKYMNYDISQKADFSNFSDAERVNEFAKEAMQWAVGTGIITGKDNGTRLDPQGNASRAECATIIMRFVEKYNK
ncbi:MAG: S-layer homology domain-containing protein [Schaedlerella sp.]|nr:S-layer homology domain-containing protein [Lachnospiraceae bacterium]MDY4202571.1 S-layer homology domain-containing protein [Schaedlerella sp.]